MKNLTDKFKQLLTSFRPEYTNNKNLSFTFKIINAEPEHYTLVIKDNKASLEGEVDNPNLTVIMDYETYDNIQSGKLNSQMAFMQGKLKIKGDMNLAMDMQKIFPIT